MKRKKIVIDARMYGLEHAGIGRYIENLIDEIKKHKLKGKKYYFVLLAKKDKFSELNLKYGDYFEINVCNAAHYTFLEQVLVPLQLIKLKPDLVHFPHFNVPFFWLGRYVVTIHDLIKHRSRGAATTTRWHLFYWLKYVFYRVLIFLTIKKAAVIIVPSRWVKKDLLSFYPFATNKVKVVYEGVAKKFVSGSSGKLSALKIVKKYKILKPYVIYVGSLYPHKNVISLVKAVKTYNKSLVKSEEELSLVVVSARNVFLKRFHNQVQKIGAKNWVVLTGFLTDEELVLLLENAVAFVWPSLIEGFGLPPLEAMSVGVPVLSAFSSCSPEIYDQAALYFDPKKKNDLVEKLRKIIKNDSLQKQLVHAGKKQVQKYSWSKAAKQTLAAYQTVLV